MTVQQSYSAFQGVREFVGALDGISSLPSLRELLDEVVPRFGIDYFLMTHHVDFGKWTPGTVQISNYPREFIANEREKGGWREDPVFLACDRTTTGFFWSELGELTPLSDRALQRVEQVRRAGLGDGFAVPNHIPGEYSGSVQFAVGTGKEFPREMASALQSLATYAFEAARQLARTHEGPLVSCAPLTDRQIECLLLVARGKSDTDIGQILGLSPRTVNSYIEAAKRRYCVATRQQLLILALFNRQITFSEVLH